MQQWLSFIDWRIIVKEFKVKQIIRKMERKNGKKINEHVTQCRILLDCCGIDLIHVLLSLWSTELVLPL